MSVYLIDTNVISELARKNPDPEVVAFVASVPNVRVSVILFHELAFGCEAAPSERRAKLAVFVSAMRAKFGQRTIPVDLKIAENAGQLRALAKAQGRVLTVADALIAASAVACGAVLATRNVKDFDGLGLAVFNPFSS